MHAIANVCARAKYCCISLVDCWIDFVVYSPYHLNCCMPIQTQRMHLISICTFSHYSSLLLWRLSSRLKVFFIGFITFTAVVSDFSLNPNLFHIQRLIWWCVYTMFYLGIMSEGLFPLGISLEWKEKWKWWRMVVPAKYR